MPAVLEKSANIEIENKLIHVNNVDKLLWPEAGVTKMQFIKEMVQLAPYILKYGGNRLLSTIRYPHGISGKSFYQKSVPKNAPDYIGSSIFHDKEYIVMENAASLVWLCSMACLEFHVAFNTCDKPDYPSYLVFDLDPSEENNFESVKEVALSIKETMESLALESFIKTSGATGLQIFIPTNARYDYGNARSLNLFFAEYFVEKMPRLLTIERFKAKRGGKIYFDYLQMWQGKSLIAPYSTRAVETANVSMPLAWEELERVRPSDFTIKNAVKRLHSKGDMFSDMFMCKNEPLDEILKTISKGR